MQRYGVARLIAALRFSINFNRVPAIASGAKNCSATANVAPPIADLVAYLVNYSQ